MIARLLINQALVSIALTAGCVFCPLTFAASPALGDDPSLCELKLARALDEEPHFAFFRTPTPANIAKAVFQGVRGNWFPSAIGLRLEGNQLYGPRLVAKPQELSPNTGRKWG